MEVQFIFMTIAFVIMLIVSIIQNRTIKRLENANEELLNKKYSEYMGFGKLYRRRYIFVNIENAGDNGALNRLVENYYGNGFDLDREKSTDRLLVFVKDEEVNEQTIEHLKEEAIETTIVDDWKYGQDPDHSIRPAIHQRIDGYKAGDKVKIVILKDD